MEEEEKGDICGKTAKSTPTEEAGAPSKGKGTEKRKEVEKSRERRSSAHGQAIRSAARMEEELSRRAKEESQETLWKRHPRRDATIRIGIVYRRNDSNIYRV